MTFYREFNQTNNKTDIGIKSAAGLYPKVLKQTDIVPDPRCMYFIFLISPKYGDKNIFLYDVLSQFPYPDITNVCFFHLKKYLITQIWFISNGLLVTKSNLYNLFMLQYNWNTYKVYKIIYKVGVKHQSVNQRYIFFFIVREDSSIQDEIFFAVEYILKPRNR